MFIRPVPASREFVRVEGLPRRTWDAASPALRLYAEKLSAHFRVPGGTMTFFPDQAQALYEISLFGSLVAPLQVSKGKTLIALMAPVVAAGAAGLGVVERPMMVLPANLIEKTEAEARMYAHHFRICRKIELVSYSILSRKNGRDILAERRPDMIIADEAHHLKNLKAGVTKKVDWYLTANAGRVRYVDLTGTAWTNSIKEIAHRVRWALGLQRAPLPSTPTELLEWAEKIDEEGEGLDEERAGALMRFVERGDWATIHDVGGKELACDLRTALRRGFSRRFFETPGIVGSRGENDVGASLQFRLLQLHPPKVVQDALKKLEEDWETPDGFAFTEGLMRAEFGRTIALGFYLRRDPWPPRVWIDARRRYAASVRYLVKNRAGLDTPQMACDAVKLRGMYREVEFETLRGEEIQIGEAFDVWDKIKPTFVYRTEPTWLSTHALDAIEAWLSDDAPGIVWCEDVALAEETARRFNLPLYATQGRERRTGAPIGNEKGDRSIVCSVSSNLEGRNLQMFSRGLITNLPPNAGRVEQTVARWHRRGIKFDVAECDIFMGSVWHREALERIFAQAHKAEAEQGQRQKVLYGDWVS